MNLDEAFLAAIVQSGLPVVMRAKAMGISPDDLDAGETKQALSFLYEYVSKYKDVPSAELMLAKTGVALESQPGSGDFFVDEMMNKRLFRRLKTGLQEAAQFLDNQKARESFQSLEQLIRTIRRDNVASSPIERLFALGPDVLTQYEETKAGKKGILTRWPALNDATLGFWPQDLVLFVARVATGKTWSSIILAHDAWEGRFLDFEGTKLVERCRKVCTAPAVEDLPCGWSGPLSPAEMQCPQCGGPTERKGYRVLYVTTEISKLRIAARFYAVRYKLPYKQFRSGKLSTALEDRLKAGVIELKDAPGMFIVGGDFDFTIGGLEGAIEEARPDLLVLDGAYLMRSDGRNRSEQAANTFDDIKRLLSRYKIPGVITSQLNRQANPNQKATVNTESIALTDVAGWNSDLVIAMIQTEAMRDDKRIVFKPLKVREGEGSEIELTWDFTTMTFNELPTSASGKPSGAGAGGDAAEGKANEDDVPF